MTKAKLQAATVGGSADDTEAAFYDALQSGDIARLMACWADEDEVVCVHPGGPRLVGLAAIRASFEQMFASGSIQAFPSQVRRVQSLASAVHNLVERIDVLTADGVRQAMAVATNVYHKTPQGWRMVVHHVTPGAPADLQDVAEAPATLH